MYYNAFDRTNPLAFFLTTIDFIAPDKILIDSRRIVRVIWSTKIKMKNTSHGL